MYTPCSVAGRVSLPTGPQLVVMVGEMIVFVHMVVVVTMLVYPELLMCPCGRVVVVSIATDPQLVGEQVLVIYMVVVIAGLGEGLLSDLLALVSVVKKALIADVLMMVSSMLQPLVMVLVMVLVMFMVWVVCVHMPM